MPCIIWTWNPASGVSLQSAILLSKRKPMIGGCLGPHCQWLPKEHAWIKTLLCCVLQTKDSFRAGNYNAITTAQREGIPILKPRAPPCLTVLTVSLAVGMRPN